MKDLGQESGANGAGEPLVTPGPCMWNAEIRAHAMTRESAIRRLIKTDEDAIKHNWEDAKQGPVIWGHMSTQSGIVIEPLDIDDGMPGLGWPRGRLMLERRFEQLKTELAEVGAKLGFKIEFGNPR